MFGQTYDAYYKIVNNHRPKLAKARSIDSLLKKESSKQDLSAYFIIADNFTNWLYKNNSLDKSISTLLNSIKLTPKDDLKSLERKWYKLAFLYRKNRNYSKSIEIYEKIIKSKCVDSYYLRSLKNIADSYYEIGDYELSRKYYDLSEKELLARKDFIGIIKNNTLASNTYNKLNKIGAKREIERKLFYADSLSRYVVLDFKAEYNLKIAFANFYSTYENRNLNQGLKYVNHALKLAKYNKDTSLITKSLLTKGILYDIESPLNSVAIFNQALKYYPKKQNKSKSFIYANLGLNKAKIGLLKESLQDQQTALKILLGKNLKNLKDLSEEYTEQLLTDQNSNDNLRTILGNLAETYYIYYKKNKNPADLRNSIQYFKYADIVIDNYFESDVSASSKFLWRKKASEIYSRAIRSCFEAKDLESAFLFMEKSKGLVLYEEMSNRKKLYSLNVPDSILSKERLLKSQLNSLERLKSKHIDSLKRVVTLQDSLDNLLKEIVREYPNYKSINKLSFPTLLQVQKTLANNEVILAYHISADNGFGLSPNTETGYGILITREEKILFEIKNLSALKTYSSDLLNKLRDKQRTTSEFTEIEEISRFLYNQLLPKRIRKYLHDKRITIIPDGYLNTIPFETLVTSTINEPTSYLIENNEIHYLFSIAFNKSISLPVDKQSSQTNFNAFAPVHFSEMSSLENSREEMKMINKYRHSNVFLEKEATASNFKNSIDRSSILHLATHANSDNKDPWIQFYDKKIHLDELSTIKNNAALVVLSACETTTGEMAAGEGVLSLARGFFYGGAQATVSSLWKVDDKSTYQLMDSFYKHLSAGQTKSSALREAKLDYLATHSGSERSPYYWSSFILTGAIDPIPLSSNSWMYYSFYILLGIIIIGVLITLSRKRNNN